MMTVHQVERGAKLETIRKVSHSEIGNGGDEINEHREELRIDLVYEA